MFSSAMHIFKEKMYGKIGNEIIWQDIWLYKRMVQADVLKGNEDPVSCILHFIHWKNIHNAL